MYVTCITYICIYKYTERESKSERAREMDFKELAYVIVVSSLASLICMGQASKLEPLGQHSN